MAVLAPKAPGLPLQQLLGRLPGKVPPHRSRLKGVYTFSPWGRGCQGISEEQGPFTLTLDLFVLRTSRETRSLTSAVTFAYKPFS